ncbi:MAG: hypothetical protein V4613_09545 [Bacteroidota bacterium]
MNKLNLPNCIDSKYLKKMRFNGAYYPFSTKYNKELNFELYEKASSEAVSENIVNIIRLCNYFNDLHCKLLNEFQTSLYEIQLSNNDISEIFIGLINEQELLITKFNNEFIKKNKNITAFDLQNGTFIRDDSPNNPQNFTSFSETLVEFANILIRYLTFSKEINLLPEETNFKNILDKGTKIMYIISKYEGIKSHFDNVLFHNGAIEIKSEGEIFFDTSMNNLPLIEQICVTMITNQRLGRYYYYQSRCNNNPFFLKLILKDTSKLVLDEILLENGFITYTLKDRTQENYKYHLEYLASLHDFYPFYSKEPLSKLQDLTIKQLLQIHLELHLLIYEVYKRGFPDKNNISVDNYKMNFVPKICEITLKSYLLKVTNCNESQIESFLKVITVNNHKSIDLYSTHLIKRGNYFYFTFLPIVKPNHFYLIDYWLEAAGEDLARRGIILEKYLKSQLSSTVQNKMNRFKLINQSNFSISSKIKEEIDLLIQTKHTLIVGEIKCVKYPMRERNYCSILTDVIGKAVIQVKRKSKFIQDNNIQFTEIYSILNKKIVEVVILNFPVYCSIEVDDVPVIDINSFLSYFKSGKMNATEVDDKSRKIVNTTSFYTNEDEFCINLESYLRNNPILNEYIDMLRATKSTIKVAGLPIIEFTDIVPASEESIMRSNI